jgi:hypothetical protein
VTVANNTCIRYININLTAESGDGDTTIAVIDEKVWKSMLEPEDVLYHRNVHSLKKGMCAPLAVYESLKSFDVAAAGSEEEFAAKHGTTPGGNQGYYDNGRTGVIQIPTLDKMIRRIDALIKEDESGKELPLVIDQAGKMTMHTTFNNFGPADFDCKIYNLNSTSSIEILNNDFGSCKSDIILGYGTEAIYGNTRQRFVRHSERVKKVKYASSSRTLTLSTDDGFNQGTFGPYARSDLTSIFESAPANRSTNIYEYKFGKDGNLPILSYVKTSLPLESHLFAFGRPPKHNSLEFLNFISCTDKSDVIRTKASSDFFEAMYNREITYWTWLKGRSIQQYAEAQKKNPNQIINQPDYRACDALKDDLPAAKAMLKDRLTAWQKKWNNAAYENRGYLKEDKKRELNLEFTKIYEDADKLVPIWQCIVEHKMDITALNADDEKRLREYRLDTTWLSKMPAPKCEDFTGGSVTPPPPPPPPPIPPQNQIDQ